MKGKTIVGGGRGKATFKHIDEGLMKSFDAVGPPGMIENPGQPRISEDCIKKVFTPMAAAKAPRQDWFGTSLNMLGHAVQKQYLHPMSRFDLRGGVLASLGGGVARVGRGGTWASLLCVVLHLIRTAHLCHGWGA